MERGHASFEIPADDTGTVGLPMNDKNYINILLQDLRKKKLVLDKIIQANQKQQEALEDPNLDPNDFDVIVEEKAGLITQLEQLDDGFTQVYERVREPLQTQKEQYADEIREMQKLIRQLMERSVDIEAQEQRNKALMTQKFANVRKQVREVRSSQKVVNKYYQNMMKSKFISPQFLDDKK